MKAFLKNLLAYPATLGLDLDDPHLTERRLSIIREKKFLNAIYREWYRLLLDQVPGGPGQILELGSGAGFVRALCDEAITSEIFWVPGVQAVLDGCDLPFETGSLRAVFLTDVLHHIPQPRRFLSEAQRCLRPGGVLAMIEPWVNSWSSMVYRNLHHEPFYPEAGEWEFPSSGPLSGANGALPWIIFKRDRGIFEKEFTKLSVERVQPMMPFRYLVSGGVSMRALAPDSTYPMWRWIDELLKDKGIFALIVVRRN